MAHREEQEITYPAHNVEAFFTTLMASISDSVILTDDQGRFIYIYPNIETLFGWTPAEIAALGSIDKLYGHMPCDPSALRPNEELKNIEQTITTKDGRERTLLVNIKRVEIESGTVLFTCRDISERKTAEREIAQKMARIDQLNKHMVGREKRIMELKHEINALLEEMGRPPKYTL